MDNTADLLAACERGSEGKVKSLLAAKNPDVNKCDAKSEFALFKASRHGHCNIVAMLLQHPGVDVNIRYGHRGRTSLMVAAAIGIYEILKLLLTAAEIDANMQDYNGWSALMIASQYGYTEIAKALLEYETNVMMRTNNGWSALEIASEHGHTNIVRLLLEYGADVNMQQNDGWSALMLASQNGHSETVKLLLKHGAAVNMSLFGDGWPALMIAIQNRSNAVTVLLKHGADLNIETNDGWSALMIASWNGHLEMIQILIKHKIDINAQLKGRWTALMIACQTGNAETAKFLLNYGAKTDIQTSKGWSALMIASQKGYTEISRLLLDHGAASNLQSVDGQTALMVATQNGYIKTAKLLLEYGADTNIQGSHGWSALMIATQKKYTDIVKLLIKYNADTNMKLNNGYSALIIACLNKHFEFVRDLLNTIEDISIALIITSWYGHTATAKFLLNHGADVNMQMDDGWSALMAACACHVENIETVEFLLKHGVHVNAQTSGGWSALLIASQYGHSEIVQLLLEYGADVNMKEANGLSASTIANLYEHNQITNLLSMFIHGETLQHIKPPSTRRSLKMKSGTVKIHRKTKYLRILGSWGSTSSVRSEDSGFWASPMTQSSKDTLFGMNLSQKSEDSGFDVNIQNSRDSIITSNQKGQDHSHTLLNQDCLSTKSSVNDQTISNNMPTFPQESVDMGATIAEISEHSQSMYFGDAEKKAHVPFLHHHLLECDHNGLEYIVKDHDITLRIPKGAVSKGEKIHFEIGVAMYGPFIFPENTRPISAITWLCVLEDDAKLKKPFQLILPHFLTGLNTERLHYHQVELVKANHSYTLENDQLIYKFNHCGTNPLFSSSKWCKSYGVFKLTHCCFYCLKAKSTPELFIDAGYCLARIEQSLPPKTNEVYFIAFYFLDTCIRALEEQFPKEEGYNISRYGDFRFQAGNTEEQYIKVVPPHEHDQCVIALDPNTAEIRASDIDFWKLGFKVMKLRHEKKMYPPRVKMTVTLLNPDHILKLPVKFEGCSRDSQLNADITFPLGLPSLRTSSTSSGSQSECRSSTINASDDKPKLRDAVKKLLPLSKDWKTIGVLLGVEKHILDKVKRDEEGVTDCLQEMLSEWLNQVDPPPTWKDLVEAVEAMNPAKAEEIRQYLAS